MTARLSCSGRMKYETRGVAKLQAAVVFAKYRSRTVPMFCKDCKAWHLRKIRRKEPT